MTEPSSLMVAPAVNEWGFTVLGSIMWVTETS